MKIVIGYLITYSYLFSILILTSILKKKSICKEETTRKMIHILVGFWWFIGVYFFKYSFHLIIPPFTFIFINYLSYKKGIIKSMEREKEKSKGTIYYALSFAILSVITYFNNDFLPFYGISVLTLAIGDGLAPFVGSKSKKKILNTKKSYGGSLVLFISAIIISILFNIYYELGFTIYKYLIIGLCASTLEFIGFNGYDNLTLPLGLSLIMYFL